MENSAEYKKQVKNLEEKHIMDSSQIGS